MVAAIIKFAEQGSGGVLVLPDSLLVVNRKRMFETAAKHRMLVMAPFRAFMEDRDGFVSYGPDFSELFRQTAGYVDRILKGEKSGELPGPGTDEIRDDRQPQGHQSDRS